MRWSTLHDRRARAVQKCRERYGDWHKRFVWFPVLALHLKEHELARAVWVYQWVWLETVWARYYRECWEYQTVAPDGDRFEDTLY